jgi:pSer/pThr/pTyr-binding forkhead associated (FHA) protein
VPEMDGPDDPHWGGNEGRPEGTLLPSRVLWLEGAAGLVGLSQLDGLEITRESGATRALARLETDGDFAVVVCDENIGGNSGLELLAAVRDLSPTTVRVLVSESLARAAPSPAVQAMVFRCVSPHCSASDLRRVIADAIDYHRLLSTCPAQPVEAGRIERDAMLPPARPEPRRPDVPSWKGFIDTSNEAAGPVLIDAPGPAPALLVLEPVAARVGLRIVGRVVELLQGATIVGRSRTCHIPIPDPQISRRHATFSNDGRQISVRNVSNTNGVRVNGVLIERDAERALAVGDRVTLGSHEIEVCALGDYCPSFEPTHSVSLRADDGDDKASFSTLVTLARVAEKYFALGQPREAERVLRPLLEGLLRHCGSGQTPAEADIQLATQLTLRIAEATHAGEWVDYLFELHTELQRPMAADVVEQLYRIVPESQAARMTCFRAYLDTLSRIAERFGPKERFLIRRIQGLETPLKMSAHV